MNQKEIAKTVGVSQAAVSHWLNGKHKPVGITGRAFRMHFPELYTQVMEEFHGVDVRRQEASK